MTTRALFILPFLVACDGGASAPSATVVRLALTSGSDAPGAGIDTRDSGGSAMAVTSASAYLRHVELYLPDGQTCESLGLPTGSGDDRHVSCDSDKVRYTGPWKLDLMTGTAEPPLALAGLPELAWRRIDLRFDDAEPSEGVVGASDPLAGLTIRAAGTVVVDGASAPFEMALKFNEDARFESDAGIVAGPTTPIAMWLDVDAWFAELPLAKCAEDGDLAWEDGTLLLEDGGSSCSDIENALKDTIKGSGQLDR